MDYEQLKNRDVLVLDGAIDRLSRILHSYLAAQKELYYNRELSLEQREQYIESLQHYQQLIDHMWKQTLEVADTSIGRQIRQRLG